MVDNTPRVLAGRYEVGDLIGRGGMAEVHIGHDTRLGRTVAIKVLRSDLARDPSFLARFRREAQAAASLNHPSIVAVYDTGEDIHTDSAGGQVHVPFIVMEYVEGHTVRDILQDGAAVPIEEAVEITVGVLSALEYSHHAGIVHRDIKPANVMITPTGAVKVMDFGIARAVADSAATMTQTHAVIGTAQYLSPEQARGEQVDARSDLYSTGCLLFELLTGRPPFVGDSPVAVAYQHVGQAPQRPSEIASDVPEVLDRITLKSLAKERDSRYSSAAEFRSDLEAAMRGGAIGAPTVAAGLAAAGAAAGAPTMAYGAPGYGDGSTQVMNPAASPWGTTGAPVSPPAGTPVGAPDPEDGDQRRKKALMWTLITVAVLAIAAIVIALVLNGGEDAPTEGTVPVLQQGVTREQAEQVITDAGFEFQAQIDSDSSAPEGTFTRQDPEGGATAALGSTVRVFFSGGPDTIGVPDVVGQSEQEARRTIEAAGLVWGAVEREPSPTVARDAVTRTDPPTGQAVQEGDTINVFLSDGTVELPDLTGLSRDDALARLQELGLNSSQRDQPSAEHAPGTVIGQRPAPGNVERGTTVEISIAVEPPTETTSVPDVRGMTWDEAQDTFGQYALNARRAQAPSNQVEAGRVISTDPAAGTQVDEGTTVVVVISSGGGGGGGGNGGGNTGSPSPTPTGSPTAPDDGDGGDEG
ncbi:Stk1 family PASTA domain-containing Ser/Thr kinase [Xylanimonas oleitrophica]|uniref:non-specific serine/threonine protein kinase n=1 Tax=Xylanimonas oleitrophica TaxID=2607479 RepID=A0A2W5Y558_9MICO|nr:Stk1 family PASTA domain-containing Ser/Thr kinase [Xylanimonas oleitrophica]PZR53174.1 Stk1 family PASTA domain-containing Ser/Thr kinase [Xylanimonas oleitrophica]